MSTSACGNLFQPCNNFALRSARIILLSALTFSVPALAQFSVAPGIPIVGAPCCTAVGDFNGDGKPDVAVLNSSSGAVTILLGNGTGSFNATPTGPVADGTSSPRSLVVGDFNGDGKLDLAVAGGLGITVLLGNGLGGFSTTPITTPVGPGVYTLAVGDFNGDGKLDLAAASANFGGSMSIFLGNGAGGFSVAPGSPFASGTYPYALAVGDFNGDGKLDLAVATALNRVVTVLLGDGKGGVASSAIIPLTSVPSDMQTGDFNKDGKLDLAVSVGNGGVTILLGNGMGGFSAAPGSPIAPGTTPHSFAVADFNGDGNPDVAFANKTSGLTVFLGDGSGGFTTAPGSPFAAGTFPYSVSVGDFNGDGKPDLVITSSITNNVTALLNTFPGTSYACSNTTPPAITSVASASSFGGYSYFASGSWLEIKGANLADPADPRLTAATSPGQWTATDFKGANAPTSLDGINVSINGKSAYVWYLSPGQLNVQAPQDSASGTVAIVVTNCKAASPAFPFNRQSLAPGFLAPPNYTANGTQYMVATFASDGAYVLNTSTGAALGLNSRPARPGDLIVAYGIGFGDVTPAILPGLIVDQGNSLINPVTISFGSAKAALSYAGLAGGFLGLYEFYITVPANLGNGDYQINVTQAGTPVPQTMYLTVHN